MSGRTSAKPISRLPLAVLCSLSDGHMLLPYLLFSGLAIKQPGNADFFVPIVIAYTVQRACLMALRGFGEITNPYRILRGGLFVAFAGALLLLFSPLLMPLQSVGALLIGAGLSCFGAMFRPMFDLLAARDPACRKSSMPGMLLYTLLSVAIVALTESVSMAIQAVFFVYLLCALIILCRFDQNGLFENRPAFDTAKRKPVFFLFGGLYLMCLLVLRQYKQSGVSVLFWLAPLALFITFLLEAFRDRAKYEVFVFRTYWAGAVKCFLLLFNLLYHSSVGNTTMVLFTNIAVVLGGFIPALLAKPLKKLFREGTLYNSCMMLASALCFLLIVPSNILNFLTILLCEGLAGIVSSDNTAAYMKDERHVPLERPLIRERINTAGGVVSQVVLLCVVYLLGEFAAHRDLMLVNASAVPDASVAPALRAACLICTGLLLLTAVLIVCTQKRREQRTADK